ncbi:ATP-binding protein [Nonomuraea sp. NPDC005650]|uniref:ATP-binding protein n=1 Tax=Nonomuraea sp. NPDC005650 TaxID=3157045 RepID=UPI0033B10FA9
MGGMCWRRVFPGRGDQAAPARRLARILLEDTSRGDDAEWVAAELISNALRHSRSGLPGGFFMVEVTRTPHSARVTVYDLGGGAVLDYDRADAAARHSEPGQQEGGYGLASVARLTADVGVSGNPRNGHAVWAELSLIPPETSETAAVHEAGRALVARAAHIERRLVEPFSVAPGAGVSDRGDQVSAFGQEPWAQVELRRLRREHPDWAFLVVRYRWMALQGKSAVIVAPGPNELRAALPHDRRPARRDGGVAGPRADPGLLEAAGLHQLESHRAVASDAVLCARRSGTGTWAAVADPPRETSWWPVKWPWSRRRTRTSNA